jgi:hypothetical protein
MRRSLLLTLTAFLFAVSTAMAAHAQKVPLCHIPPGDPANAHTISVAPSALDAHLAHGDYVGECASSNATVLVCKCSDGSILCDEPPADGCGYLAVTMGCTALCSPSDWSEAGCDVSCN